MRIEFLVQKLADQGLGVIGESLFAHEMPADCKKGVMLKMPIAGIDYDPTMPGFFNDRFQIIVRHSQHVEGQALADAVMKAIVHKQSVDYFDQPGNVFAMRINHLLPAALPIRYPRSDGNGIEWSLNFRISFVLPEI